MSEEINYILESLRFKTSIYRDAKKRNLTFNDDDYYSNILIEYIEQLQQENQKLKEELETSKQYEDYYKDLCDKALKTGGKYISVIKEIREYIKENVFKHYDSYNDIEYYEIEEPDKLLQILDKVKE